jgi:ankyrin repeat protein
MDDAGALRRRAPALGATLGADDDARAFGERVARGDVAGTLRDAEARPELLRARVDDEGRRATHAAAARGRAGALEALLASGAAADARDGRGRTALHEAAKRGDGACARAILDARRNYGARHPSALGARVDANARDAAGSTPLLEATSREMIATLLREGADGSMRRGDGSNAVHLACDRADGWAVEALLGCGVDCDARDGSKRTALHRARDARSVVALCASGADVECVDARGHTPLHAAAIEGKPEVVVPLANAGARLRARTRGGFLPGATAADLAAKYGHDDVARLLADARQVSRVAYLSMCAVNHEEERIKKQMRRSSEKRAALLWGALVAVGVVLFALVVGHFWFAGAKRELREWREIRQSREKAKILKAKQQEAAAKAELKRKMKAEAAAEAWRENARQNVERVLRCGVHGTLKDGVKKGGVHRCILFGQDGKGLSKEANAACGVCADFLAALRERLDASNKGKTEAEVDAHLTAACKKAEGRTSKVCDSLLAARKDLNRQMSFGAPPAKICARLGSKDPELCAVKPAKEGDLSSDGKGDAAARDAFRKLSVFVHPDKHDNSPQATEAFKMLNTARAYFDSRAKLNAKRAASQAKT